MPSRVGHITEIYDDGTCRVRNDIENQEYFGRLIVMSGGMLCFDIVDERKRTVASGRVRDTDEAKPVEPKKKVGSGKRRRGQRVRVASGAADSTGP